MSTEGQLNSVLKNLTGGEPRWTDGRAYLTVDAGAVCVRPTESGCRVMVTAVDDLPLDDPKAFRFVNSRNASTSGVSFVHAAGQIIAFEDLPDSDLDAATLGAAMQRVLKGSRIASAEWAATLWPTASFPADSGSANRPLVRRPLFEDELAAAIMSERRSRSIVVVGAQGSGRTTVAELLAKRLAESPSAASRPVIPVDGGVGVRSLIDTVELGFATYEDQGAVVVIDNLEEAITLGGSVDEELVQECIFRLRMLHSSPAIASVLVIAERYLGAFQEADPLFAEEWIVLNIPRMEAGELREVIDLEAERLSSEHGVTISPRAIDAALGPRLPTDYREHPGLACVRLENAVRRCLAAGDDVVDAADLSADRPAESAGPRDIDEILADLDKQVGMAEIKETIRDLANAHAANQLRKAHDEPTIPLGLNLVFTGSAGTGKTMTARIIAELYDSLGLLPRGHLFEASRGDLVAAYEGQTARQVRRVLREADGGVLFIDEVYALTPEGVHDDQYGQEAIAELLKGLEDQRETLAVIVAGYRDKMEHFLDANEGLRSRFAMTIEFPDYSVDELMEIWQRMAAKSRIHAPQETLDAVRNYLESTDTAGSWGNARGVRKLMEKMFARMAGRARSESDGMQIEDVKVLLPEDVPPLDIDNDKPSIGFGNYL